MDMVQDVFMCAFRDLEEFNYTSEGDFLRWLGIAKH